jgi:two-component system, OmpR family, sensor histidine kinase KdpD
VPHPLKRVLLRFAACSAVVAAVSTGYMHLLHVNPTTVALTFLVAVLTIAAAWGLRYSVYTSLIATACFNFFFLPPIRTWTISDPQNWAALVVFLITAMIASELSDKARRQAAAAETRRREVERLYAFSQQLLVKDNIFELLNELPKTIVDEFSVSAAAIFLASRQRVYYSDVSAHVLLSSDELKAVGARGEPTAHTETGVAFIPLRIGVRAVGSLGVIGNLSYETLEAIGSMVGIATERAGAVEKLSHAEAARENERLRSALLDAVTHEFRTPLTSIKAAASTLASGVQLDDTARRDLVAVVEEEADRLNRLVGEAAEMAQLDAHQVHLEFENQDIRNAIESVLETLGPMLDGREVEVMIASDLPRVRMDKQRIAEVIRHLLENALKYSPQSTPVHLTADRAGKHVKVSVADHGPGIDDFEQSLIFEKFYRGRGHRSVQGTGMGLPISRAIVEAHDGSITVISQLGSGSVFSFTLPIEP